MVFQPLEGEVLECKGTPRGSKWLVVSALKVSRMLLKGCANIGEYRGYNKKVVTELVDVRVICRFPDVFPKELSGLPSDQKIELLPGTTPISKARYQMALAELKELKQQL